MPRQINVTVGSITPQGGGGDFDVLTLSPYAWYKADSLALADGAAVSTWPNSSVGGPNLTDDAQATQRPSYRLSSQNGKPAVEFDGTNHHLLADTSVWVGNLAQPTTVLLVASMTSGDMFFDGVSGSNRHTLYHNGSGIEVYAGASGPSATLAKPIPMSTWTAVFDGTSSSIRRNAAPFASGAASVGSQGLSSLRLMTNTSASIKTGGRVCELIVINRLLTAQERTDVEAHLTAKWGTT